MEKYKENYMDDPKKKKENITTENLLYNGETLKEKKEREKEYKENNLNE